MAIFSSWNSDYLDNILSNLSFRNKKCNIQMFVQTQEQTCEVSQRNLPKANRPKITFLNLQIKRSQIYHHR